MGNIISGFGTISNKKSDSNAAFTMIVLFT